MVDEGKGFQEDPRLEKFVENLRSGMNRTEAAMDAGYGKTYDSAKALAWRLCRRREVAEMLSELPPMKCGTRGSKPHVARLAKGVAEGKDLPTAAAEAGYRGKDKHSLEASASRSLSYSGNVRVISRILESHGLDDDCGARVLKEGLSSMRQVVVYQGKDSPAIVVEYPDNVARKMYLDVLMRLRGHYRGDSDSGAAVVVRIENMVRNREPVKSIEAAFTEVKKEGE